MGPNNETAQIAALNKLILRSIVDHAVVTMDAEGLITSWNEGAERILGWTEDEIVGQSADVFFTHDDTEDNRAQIEMRLAVENGRAEDVRWHVRKDGERFWGSGLMMPLLDATNLSGDPVQDATRITGFVKIFRDRTEERDASRRMERLQDRAQLAMRRSGTVGVYDNDLKNDIIIADHTCARMHSVAVELGESGTSVDKFFQGIVAEDQEAARKALEAAIETGEGVDVTYRILTDGPKPTWIQSQGTVQRDEDGAPSRLVGIVVDITDQREHLAMQEARLEFSDKVRDMTDPIEIAELASRVIGETLYVSRVGHGYVEDDGNTIVVEADWNIEGGLSLVGRHKFSDFGSYAEVLRNGEEVVMQDVNTDTRVERADRLDALEVRAQVNLPLMQRGKLKALLFVNDAKPRVWSEAEITFLGAMFDRTYAAIDRLKLETERDDLAGEIAHRMKNVLTMAQVVVKQSLRGVDGIEDASHAIAARFRAMAAAQDVLTRGEEQSADILSVIETSLKPHLPDRTRIIVSGPSVSLDSSQVIGLSLALHELATNAAKYGALSNDAGQVEISWD